MCLWMTEVVVVVYWLTHSTENSWSVDSNPTHRHITSKMAYLSTESHNDTLCTLMLRKSNTFLSGHFLPFTAKRTSFLLIR